MGIGSMNQVRVRKVHILEGIEIPVQISGKRGDDEPHFHSRLWKGGVDSFFERYLDLKK